MLRSALLVTPFLLLGCAASRTSSSIVGDAPIYAGFSGDSGTFDPGVEALSAPDAAAGVFTDFALDPQVPPHERQARMPRQRLNVKGGWYDSSDDELDDGYIINLSWMRPVSEVFSSEVEIGYFDASGSEGLVDRDVWGIPFMANGRLTLPVGKRFEIFGGVGIGSIYYDADIDVPGISVSADGFLFAGNGFFGAAVQLGESLWVGIEDKYYVTDSASDLDGDLDANVVMLTLGFAR